MKNLILKIFAAVLLLAFCASSAAAIVPANLPIKLMYAEPNEDAEIVFEIPVEIALLSLTEDLNWFRVKIRFEFAFIVYEYIGWVHLPVGEIFNLPKLAEENIP